MLRATGGFDVYRRGRVDGGVRDGRSPWVKGLGGRVREAVAGSSSALSLWFSVPRRRGGFGRRTPVGLRGTRALWRLGRGETRNCPERGPLPAPEVLSGLGERVDAGSARGADGRGRSRQREWTRPSDCRNPTRDSRRSPAARPSGPEPGAPRRGGWAFLSGLRRRRPPVH